MKASLEFDLPEESREHALAVNAGELASLISHLDQRCRDGLKHGSPFERADDVMQWIRDEINPVRHLIES